MCGLAGFWHPESSAPDGQLHEAAGRMADALVHRGPDDRGTWVDEQAGVALGFRRLAILDLSPAGHQPMVSRDDRYVVVFNGEIYNYQDLRAELEGLGARFRGTSDTEVMLAGFERWGPAATIARLWGMFAIALWDRHERTLWIARDRLGKKPLYYGWCEGHVPVRLGAEGAAGAPGLPDAGVAGGAGLVPALRLRARPAQHLRGHSQAASPAPMPWCVKARRRVVTRYWDARAVAADGTARPSGVDDAEPPSTELDALLRDATRRRMVADVPLGAFLSGGIDSSAVVALMQAESARPVRTFTIGFEDADYDEAQRRPGRGRRTSAPSTPSSTSRRSRRGR